MRFSEFLAAGKPKGSLDEAGYIPLQARDSQGQRAGLFTRTLAAIIDVVAVALVTGSAWLGIFLFLWALTPTERPTMPPGAWFLFGGVLLLWLSWTIAYATNGRTLGNWAMGIMLVNRHGHAMAWPTAAARSLANIAFPVGLAWVIPSAQNRSAQDVVFRTSVIYAWTTKIDTRDL